MLFTARQRIFLRGQHPPEFTQRLQDAQRRTVNMLNGASSRREANDETGCELMPEPQAGLMRVMRLQDLPGHSHAIPHLTTPFSSLGSRTLGFDILACLKPASHPLGIHAAHQRPCGAIYRQRKQSAYRCERECSPISIHQWRWVLTLENRGLTTEFSSCFKFRSIEGNAKKGYHF